MAGLRVAVVGAGVVGLATTAALLERGADVQAELQLSVREALAGGRRGFELPTTAPCPRCGGTGFLGEHVCPTCMGVGQVRGRKTVEVAIPRSLRDGQTLRLPNVIPKARDYASSSDDKVKAIMAKLNVDSNQPTGDHIVVDKSEGVLKVMDAADKLVA